MICMPVPGEAKVPEMVGPVCGVTSTVVVISIKNTMNKCSQTLQCLKNKLLIDSEDKNDKNMELKKISFFDLWILIDAL